MMGRVVKEMMVELVMWSMGETIMQAGGMVEIVVEPVELRRGEATVLRTGHPDHFSGLVEEDQLQVLPEL